jgi:SAM-dependent methyltransferase
VTEDVRAYYAGFGEREWDRLEHMPDGRIEFAVTCDALARYLPPCVRVLDLGGGPGRYTIWLAQRGHRVTLADLSPEMLAIARQRIHEASVEGRVEAVIEADARDLGAWADGSFDAAVCLGPFYHLPEADDRNRAAAELRRVLVGDGVVFIALMPALAFLRRSLALPDERRHLLEPGFNQRVLHDGVFVNDVPGRFTQGYGVKLEEVGPFFSRFGFEQVALLSAESLTVGLETVLPELLADEALHQLVFELAIGHAGDPSILGLARHLLYVGRCRSAGPAAAQR